MGTNFAGLGIVLSGGLLLAGCVAPAPYDQSQVSLGIAQQTANRDACNVRNRNGEFPTSRGYTDCLVAVKAQFAAAIKLKEPGYLAAYTQRMNMVGDQSDAKKITDQEALEEIRVIEKDFNQQVVAAYRENRREREEAAAKMAAFGQAMSNAGAALQADTPQVSPSPMVNCTSRVLGGRANGDNRGAVLATNCQ